jgi:flagellar hook-associated protein 3 FlgL
MRISTQMSSEHVLSWLQTAEQRLYDTQARASSNKRILRPSDDPGGAAHASRLRSELARDTQYGNSVQTASYWLKLAEPVLKGVNDEVVSLRDLAVQAAGLATTDDQRAQLAVQVRQIRDSLMDIGNTKSNGRYLLAGAASATQPFEVSGTPPVLSYQGSAEAPQVRIGQSSSLSVGVTGDRVFNVGGAADPAHDDLYTIVSRLADQLEANDVPGISSTIGDLEFLSQNAIALRGDVGFRLQACESATTLLQANQDAGTASISQVEDADMTQVLIDLSEQQNAYQAAAGVAATLHKVSLLDYLK